MSKYYLQKIKESSVSEIEECGDSIIEELIYSTYISLFSEKIVDKAVNRIPTVGEIFNKADYDFDVKCYDVVYQIDKSALTHESIMLLLQKKQCVFRWGISICGDAQIPMFSELYDSEDTATMIGENIER